MHLLDFLLLSSTVIVLLLITAARMTGKLPDRRSGWSSEPGVTLKRFDGARISGPRKPVKLGTYEGILVQHDGPIRHIPPLITVS